MAFVSWVQLLRAPADACRRIEEGRCLRRSFVNFQLRSLEPGRSASRLIIAIVASCLTVVTSGTCAPRRTPSPPQDARSTFPVPADVRVVHDVVYALYGARRLTADVYLPDAPPTRLVPGVLVVRGGGWQSGDKETFGFIAARLAEAGFVAASVEYRTSEEAPFPAAVQDVKAAVRWMRASAGDYGIDPRAIGAVGASAGAHLVALLATSDGVADLEGEGGHAGTSSRIQAAVAMACVCTMDWKDPAVKTFLDVPAPDLAEAKKTASPVTYVSSHAAPLLLLHSRTDPEVPYTLSRRLKKACRRA